MIDRRTVRTAAALLVVVGLAGWGFSEGAHAQTPPTTRKPSVPKRVKLTRSQSSEVEPFVDPLPIPQRIVIPKGSAKDITIPITQFRMRYHRDLPETTVWGYQGTSPGPTIEVESGQMVRVHWKNQLPKQHLFPRDESGMGGMMGSGMPGMPGHDHGSALAPVRTVTHLHGAVVSQPSTTDRARDNDGWPDAWITPGQEQLAEYPNQQTARTLWYHDHAMASTARNVYAGLAGLYLIHDAYERSLNLPSGAYDIPLFIQSRGFNDDGSLYYPTKGFAEFYGNAHSVNGKVMPFLEVEPRKYRFRVVNGSNARTLALKLVDPETGAAGPAFYQIGTDSGFLSRAVKLNDPANANAPRLEVAPGERGDIIVDFSKDGGKSFLLHNNSITDPGEGEIDLPAVMLVKVTAKLTATDTSAIPMTMKPIAKLSPASASATRQISFGQMDMPGSSSPMMMLNGKHWHDPIEERPVLGTTEVWNIVNPLPDTHPFHIHLVEFQIVDRTPIDAAEFARSGKVVAKGRSRGPDANEAGWKDTVRIYPATATRLIMRFAPFTGFYVYHCHILEHEDMDMMRPFEVVAAPK